MQMACPMCSGAGVVRPPMSQAVVCPTCGGTGYLVDGRPTTVLPVQAVAAGGENPNPNRNGQAPAPQ